MRWFRVLSMVCVLASGVSGAGAAQAPLRPPGGELACNALCRWWMSLGDAPTGVTPRPPDPPALAETRPAPSKRAVLRTSPAARPRPARVESALARADHPAPLLPRLASDPPPRRLWGVPLPGSAPILPTAFAAAAALP